MTPAKYIVVNEHTLCYRIDGGWDWLLGVLAGSILRGSPVGRLDGTMALAIGDRIRSATVADFELYRVSPTGHIT